MFNKKKTYSCLSKRIKDIHKNMFTKKG